MARLLYCQPKNEISLPCCQKAKNETCMDMSFTDAPRSAGSASRGGIRCQVAIPYPEMCRRRWLKLFLHRSIWSILCSIIVHWCDCMVVVSDNFCWNSWNKSGLLSIDDIGKFASRTMCSFVPKASITLHCHARVRWDRYSRQYWCNSNLEQKQIRWPTGRYKC